MKSSLWGERLRQGAMFRSYFLFQLHPGPDQTGTGIEQFVEAHRREHVGRLEGRLAAGSQGHRQLVVADGQVDHLRRDIRP